jgi:hypothetical protein
MYTGPDGLQIAVHGSAYGVCARLDTGTQISGAYFRAADEPFPSGTLPTRLHDASTVINTGGNTQHPTTGGSVDGRARSMVALMGDGSHRSAAVLNGTWLLLLPDRSSDGEGNYSPPGTIKSVTVRDEHGTVIYDGPLAKR